jgi:hypothetical protein
MPAMSSIYLGRGQTSCSDVSRFSSRKLYYMQGDSSPSFNNIVFISGEYISAYV